MHSKLGEIKEGIISGIQPYGAFVQLDTGEKDYAMKMEEHRISVIDWHYHIQMPITLQYQSYKQTSFWNFHY